MSLILTEKKIFGKPMNEIQITVEYLTSIKEYEKKKKNTDYKIKFLSPLEKLFESYQSALNIGSKTPLHIKVKKVDKEADLRNIWFRVIKKLSPEEFDRILRHKIYNTALVKDVALTYFLLPEDKKLSYHIRKMELDRNLGVLSLLPHEITIQIFRHLSLGDISATSRVSKFWLKSTTSRQVWASRSTSGAKDLDPFICAQNLLITKKIWTPFRGHYIYATDVEVTNGEGLLVCEEGYLQGIKLNGQPLASSWFNETGSLARCMVRSKVLTKDEISFAVKNIESFLNEGTLDFLTLGDTLKPFLNCMTNGRYRIRVQSHINCWLLEYNSNDGLDRMAGDVSSDEENIYCTQPSDLLSAERIKFYEDQIRQGKRPAVLAIIGDYDYFVIDGHHKIKAYYNLQKELQMTLISISACDPRKISKQEELAYVQHSARGLESLEVSRVQNGK
jgi:hypothetical protein